MRLFLILSLLLFTGSAMAIEEAKYTVTEKSGDFELRAYSPKIIAETIVTGSLDDASSAGFKLIADYIFGNNTSRSGGNEKISMTAPVTMEPQSDEEPQSEKISMTAPVSIEKASEEKDAEKEIEKATDKEQQWRMHFVMPSEYTLETLPKPNNPAVTLRQIDASKYAVIGFSGFTGEKKVAKKTAELMAWLKSKNINPIAEPQLARYNPPWTLPFLRRNEVMVQY